MACVYVSEVAKNMCQISIIGVTGTVNTRLIKAITNNVLKYILMATMGIHRQQLYSLSSFLVMRNQQCYKALISDRK